MNPNPTPEPAEEWHVEPERDRNPRQWLVVSVTSGIREVRAICLLKEDATRIIADHAEVKRLREALEQIASPVVGYTLGGGSARKIAQDALSCSESGASDDPTA